MFVKPTKNDLKRVSQTIGVYIFYGANNEPLYIGKSINIKARLLSHFENAKLDEREHILFEQAKKIAVIPVESEFKSLLYEAELIRRMQPKFNRIWKDDKSYLYIAIDLKAKYPSIQMARARDLQLTTDHGQVTKPTVISQRSKVKGQLLSFGPFSSIKVVERLLREIRKSIPFATHARVTKRGCFYNKIGLCNPCPNIIEHVLNGQEKEAVARLYGKNIMKVIRILRGKTDAVAKEMYRELKTVNEPDSYEEALRLRNRIFRFENLIHERVGLEKENAVDVVARINPTAALISFLKPYFPHLESLHRIECYDISNLSFQKATAAMVVATDGIIDKSQYRKFRIRNLKSNSDFQMIRETLERRFRNSWEKPNLLVIDGGKPQVRTVLKVLRKLNSDIPVIGLAKNPDRIIIGVSNLPTRRLQANNSGFNLLRLLRDEAHRFSKKYHTLLRDRALLP